MRLPDHLAALRREGELLAAVVAEHDLDTAVPTCPEWVLRDLVAHLGGVHRWAAQYPGRGLDRPMGAVEEAVVMAPPDGDTALLGWFRDGHATLLHTLETADPDVACWSFLRAPSPLRFWGRRQAHETAIHRADAQLAVGAVTPFPPVFAADGIDELLTGFVTRRGTRLAGGPPCVIHVRTTDTGDGWLVDVGAERVTTRRGDGPADCRVSGDASQVYLLMWNRRTVEEAGVEVTGDPALLRRWRESVHVRWS